MRRYGIAALALTLLLVAGTARGVVINEFYYGTPTPGDNEWIELYNLSGMDIDLTNWAIVVANDSAWRATSYTIASGRPDAVIGGNNYFLVMDGAGNGEEDLNAVNLAVGRDSGTAYHGIALLDDLGTTIDTVIYWAAGATNVHNLKDDDGETTAARMLFVSGDQSYTRDTFHTDTNVSYNDFSGTGTGGTPVPAEVVRFELE